jgi:hypothetical protein
MNTTRRKEKRSANKVLGLKKVMLSDPVSGFSDPDSRKQEFCAKQIIQIASIKIFVAPFGVVSNVNAKGRL